MKTPRPDLVDSPMHLRDFESEAWVGLEVHPNTVSCTCVRRLDDGVSRVFAEWVDGGSLADAIRNRTLHQGMSSRCCGDYWMWRSSSPGGLEHAHANGLIHQDIKPANVLLAGAGARRPQPFGALVSGDGCVVVGNLYVGAVHGCLGDIVGRDMSHGRLPGHLE